MRFRALRTLAAALFVFIVAAPTFAACVSLTPLGATYGENFNTLAASGTSSTIPPGWAFSESLTNANSLYTAGTGSSNAGDTYSFGTTAADRALGTLRSGNLASIVGACFTNDSGATIGSLAIAYTGEQWREGVTNRNAADRLDFQYSTDATSLTTGAWTDVNALDFNSPNTTANSGALDGNLPANRTSISNTITGLAIPSGATFFIRWTDFDISSSDDGLAVDDFSLTPQAAVAVLSINDVSVNEATTPATFTVSLSLPAGPGGVTFHYATTDGTATSPLDYIGSAGDITIPEGVNGTAISIPIVDDALIEGNELFSIDLTLVTGALAGDPHGVATIVDDDQPALTINDVTVVEGNSGTTNATFTVSLSAPAIVPVTFNIATADGTATVADADYIGQSFTGQTIGIGQWTYTFAVTVSGDTKPELDETFTVNVTNVSNASVADGQGVGTIVSDDFTAIHTIQASGATSPLANTTVVTRGIVTALKNNGFFLQEPDETIDADPLTSEGIFVFTSAAPPSTAAVGNLVLVRGNVQEFVPPSDPASAPTTEISGSPTIQFVSAGNALPAPIALTSANTDLERFEGMRVTATLDVVAPTDGNVNEPSATSTTTGVFYGVLHGVARPYREPGINISDPVPAPNPPNVPRFDENFERIRVDSDAPPGRTSLEVGFGQRVTLTGPVDFAFRVYNILPDPGAATIGGAVITRAAATPQPNEFTVATENLERFYNDVNDPDLSGSNEPILSPAAFANRLRKASLGIRNFLNTPDVLGLEEMENLPALQSLAGQINSDAAAAGQPNPNYVAYLSEGNDIGGIDVGFLVKTASVNGTPRVEVLSVIQYNKGEPFTNPDGTTSLLNDRPPLVLRAIIHFANGTAFPVTVIVNHLRSLSGVDGTDGARIRSKRRAQAESLANLIQSFQTAGERVVSVGDYNAFQFNDGFTDSIGTIKGTPTPADQVVLPSPDLVDPDLINLDDLVPASERYSFSFDGNAQALDHILITSALNSAVLDVRYDHARINGDLPEMFRNDSNSAFRISDHDPAVAYFTVPMRGTLQFSSATYAVNEAAGTFNVTVTRTGGSDGQVSASYTIAAGTAGVNDFTAGSGVITFADRETSKTFPVTINDDQIDENDETVLLTLSQVQGGAALGATSSATLTIEDDDPPATFTISDVTVPEGATTGDVTVSVNGATEKELHVAYQTSNGTAGSGTDYQPVSGTLTFAAGVTSQIIQVPIVDDAVNEANETFFVNLSTAVDATITKAQGAITIVDDDPAPVLSIEDLSVTEGDSGSTKAMVTVSLAGATEQTVTVHYATADGTASAGSDYDRGSGTLTFAPGMTAQTIPVPISGDVAYESDEVFTVNLTSPQNATIGDDQSVVTITNDDAMPSLSVDDVAVVEGSDGASTHAVFTVSLAGATALLVTVNFSTADGTATEANFDYIGNSGTLLFSPGIVTQTIDVTVNGDFNVEPDETFFVNLSTPTSATMTDDQGTGTITNDDLQQPADLKMSMESSPSAPPRNSVVNFKTTIYNAGPADSINVVVSDTIPPGTTLVSASSSSGKCSDGPPVTCSIGRIAAGTSAMISVRVKLPGTAGPFTNKVSATSDTPDPGGANASLTVTTK